MEVILWAFKFDKAKRLIGHTNRDRDLSSPSLTSFEPEKLQWEKMKNNGMDGRTEVYHFYSYAYYSGPSCLFFKT